MADDLTAQINQHLLRFHAGDQASRAWLLEHTYQRLEQLARRMLHGGFTRVESFEQTGDVIQEAYLRLLKNWDSFLRTPDGSAVTSAGVYLMHASRLIREVLIDLARHHHGRNGGRPLALSLNVDQSGAGIDPANDTYQPDTLALFSEFHEAVVQLPKKLREVVDLRWYQGLSHQEIAELLGLGESTVRKYWVEARLKLMDHFQGSPFNWSIFE